MNSSGKPNDLELKIKNVSKIITSLEKINWKKIILRDIYNEKPSLFFLEDCLLKDYEFKPGKQVLIQEYKFYDRLVKCSSTGNNKKSSNIEKGKEKEIEENEKEKESNKSLIQNYFTLSKEKIQITLRKWEQDKWNLTEPVEVFISKKSVTYSHLYGILNSLYPEIQVSRTKC